MKFSGESSSVAGWKDRAREVASVLQMELPAVELERHTESSSKSHGSTLLKISIKSRELARELTVMCDA
jgi:hypothetical protein